ncbi:MAG: F0F1 ATP synthase subunit B' [Beijerinckiaceae bacterium]|jgi:F-type H+-transporting ATPase subunit b|nr:F0F1 ATP synthase subunit B' [Beijerinckiaceae bacterium]
MASPQKTGTEVPGGAADVGFPPFKTETFASQLLWLAIFFGLLYWLVSKVFAPRLTDVIEGRASRIARDLDDAAAAKAKAEEAGRAYETSLAEAKAKAQSIAQAKRDEVNAGVEARRKALEGDLAAKLAAAEAQIATTKTKAMANVEGIAAEAASAIVQRLGGSAPAKGDLDAALKAALKA